MTHTSHFQAAAILFLLCSVLGISAQAQNAKPNNDDQALQSLMNEVRLLRQTLQRTGLNAYRSQIILEGLRTHQDQVERIGEAIEAARDDLEKVEQTIPRFEEQGKLMEARISRESDPEQRARLEFDFKQSKMAVEQYKARVDRLKERDVQLNIQLRAAQSRVSELEGRLDSLEREIEIEMQRLRVEEKTTNINKQP